MKTATLLLLSFASANATAITVSMTTGTFTQRTGMTGVSFDSSASGSQYISGDATYLGWGNGPVPFADGAIVATSTGPLTPTSGQIIIMFDQPIVYFGLHSVYGQSWSTVAIYTPDGRIGQLVGGPLMAGPLNNDYYLNFDVVDGAAKYVILTSAMAPLVTDHHTYGVIAAPEPGTFLLVGLGLAVTMRSRK